MVEELAGRAGSALKRHKSGSLIAEVILSGGRAVLARPAAFMNDSGRPVGALLRFYKSPPQHLVVVHDELDIPFGRVRIKAGGGTAGHNGLASVVSHIGSRDFVRVRLGISRPGGGRDAVGYVLADFSPAERKQLPEVVGRAADAVERLVERGVEAAMNEFNPDPELL